MKRLLTAVVALGLGWSCTPAEPEKPGPTFRDTGAVDPIAQTLCAVLKPADHVVRGKITSWTGPEFVQGMPFTPLSVEVVETLRGGLSGQADFRVIGYVAEKDGQYLTTQGSISHAMGEKDAVFIGRDHEGKRYLLISGYLAQPDAGYYLNYAVIDAPFTLDQIRTAAAQPKGTACPEEDAGVGDAGVDGGADAGDGGI